MVETAYNWNQILDRGIRKGEGTMCGILGNLTSQSFCREFHATQLLVINTNSETKPIDKLLCRCTSKTTGTEVEGKKMHTDRPSTAAPGSPNLISGNELPDNPTTYRRYFGDGQA